MNFCTVLLVLSCVFVYAKCETCTTNGDCSATSCSTGSTVICQHPDGSDGIVADGGLCTCESSSGQCSAARDCYGDGAPSLNCPDSSRHCYDEKCICDRFPIGK